MASYINALRGDRLARVQRAPATLEEEPLRLDHARSWFSDSPPPYTSNPSSTTTWSASPNPSSEEQRHRQQRLAQLKQNREASEPYNQFAAQRREEEKRIYDADLKGTHRLPIGIDVYTIALENVKKRWVEQGIWNNKWSRLASGRWKHEEPLELESESETDSEAESPPVIFSLYPHPKPRRPKSNEEKLRIAERRVVREREREASRPYYQFVYQISKEREQIQDESTSGEGASMNLANINTRAYENVKNTWKKRGIWNRRWGILPGMSWKHEEPFDDEAADGPVPVPADPAGIGSHEAGEAPIFSVNGAPIRYISGHPVTNPFEIDIFTRNSPPVESNYGQGSGDIDSSQQGLSADFDSARLENVDAKHSPSVPNSLSPSSGKRALRPTTRQALRPSKRKPSGQLASASLGSVHPLKVSKASRKKKPRPRKGLNISQKVSSGGLPMSSDVDAAEPQPTLHRATPRRSKRIKPPIPSVASNSKRTAQSKSKQKIADNMAFTSSAKPQGISKRPSAKTTREGKERMNN